MVPSRDTDCISLWQRSSPPRRCTGPCSLHTPYTLWALEHQHQHQDQDQHWEGPWRTQRQARDPLLRRRLSLGLRSTVDGPHQEDEAKTSINL